MIRYTSSIDWGNTRQPGNDWIWIQAGTYNSFEALKVQIVVRLQCLLMIQNSQNGKTIRFAVIEKLVADNG